MTLCLPGGREQVLKDTEPESISDTTDLALPPEMPILIDFHALKDILGPPMYEMEVSVFVGAHSVWLGGLAGESAWEFGATEFCLKIGDSPALVLNASAQCDSLAFAQSQRPSLSSPGNAVWPDAVPPSPSVRAVSLTAPDFPLSQSASLLSMRSGARGLGEGCRAPTWHRTPGGASQPALGGIVLGACPGGSAHCVCCRSGAAHAQVWPRSHPPLDVRPVEGRRPQGRGPRLSCGSRSGRH